MLEEKRKGDLTDLEIEEYLEKYHHKVRNFSGAWSRQYTKLSFDELLSVGMEAMWKCLCSYKHQGGMPLEVWIKKWTWKLIGQYCRAEYERMKRWNKVNACWPGEMDFAGPAKSNDLERNHLAAQLKDLAGQELTEKEYTIFNLYFIEELNAVQIADTLQISKQAVRQRIHRMIARLQDLVRERPEFKDMGLGAKTVKNAGPRFRRVPNSFEWVDTAAA